MQHNTRSRQTRLAHRVAASFLFILPTLGLAQTSSELNAFNQAFEAWNACMKRQAPQNDDEYEAAERRCRQLEDEMNRRGAELSSRDRRIEHIEQQKRFLEKYCKKPDNNIDLQTRACASTAERLRELQEQERDLEKRRQREGWKAL